MGVSNDTGLSNVVNGDVEWRTALQTNPDLPHLSICPPGLLRGRPPMVLAKRFAGYWRKRRRISILSSATRRRSSVSPKACRSPLWWTALSLWPSPAKRNDSAVASVLSSLRRLHANVLGLALNEVRADMSERYYYYGYYGKYYSRYYKPLSS